MRTLLATRGRKRTWAELSGPQRAGLVVVAAVEAVVTTVAARDLAARDAAQVRGPKLLWSLALMVQPVGPLAYLLVGRR